MFPNRMPKPPACLIASDVPFLFISSVVINLAENSVLVNIGYRPARGMSVLDVKARFIVKDADGWVVEFTSKANENLKTSSAAQLEAEEIILGVFEPMFDRLVKTRSWKCMMIIQSTHST